MKRALVLTLMVALFAAACTSTASDEPAAGEGTTPTITVYRTPT